MTSNENKAVRRSAKMGAWRLWTALATSAAVLGAVAYLGLRSVPPPPVPEPVPEPRYEIAKTVTYSFTLQNRSGRLLTGGEFWAYAPHRETATQRCCQRLDASAPFEIEPDADGNQVLHFRLAPLPPYAARVIQITADLRMAATPNPLPAGPTPAMTRPEPFVESDHPAILSRAAVLRAPSPLETARRTFQWVIDHLRDPGYVREEHGALYALQHRSGDCTESMDLFVALARANGVPSQRASGYVVEGSGVLRAAAYHDWALFYADGVWRISDPQRRAFATGDADYVAFRVGRGGRSDARRFWFSGTGLEARMN